MIKFDLNKLEKKLIYVSSINSKGDIFYYDSLEKGEKRKKYTSDRSIYAKMKAKKQSTRFITPRQSFITLYDGIAIGIDPCGISLHYYDGVNKTIKQNDQNQVDKLINSWIEYHKTYKQKLIKMLDDNNIPMDEIYFDGLFFCHIPKEIKESKKKKWVCDQKNFFLTNVRCISSDLSFYQRKSLCFTIQNDPTKEPVYVFFPTFSTTQETLRKKQKNRELGEENLVEQNVTGLEVVNRDYFVNLNFPIDSARYIGDVFGVGSLEWLNIRDILLDVGILNLHKIDPEVRKVNLFNDNVKDCLAWLATFLYKSENATQLNCIRTLYSKLLNPKQHLTSRKVLKKMENNTYIPELIDVSNLKAKFKELPKDKIVIGKTKRKKRKIDNNEILEQQELL